MICEFCNNVYKPGHRCKQMIIFYKKLEIDLKDEVIKLYISDELSVEEIAIYFSSKLNKKLGRQVFDKILHKNNIEIRKPNTTEKSKQKYIKTCQERYGENITNTSQLKTTKDKIQKTVFKKYGETNLYKTTYFKDIMWIKTGKEYIEKSDEYIKFKNDVRNNFTKVKKQFIKNLNNFMCYYTGVELSFSVHYNDLHYATIDHKISVYQAFLEKWTVDKTNDINNLCLCSRLCNMIKNNMSENEFLLSDKYSRILEYENNKGFQVIRKIP